MSGRRESELQRCCQARALVGWHPACVRQAACARQAMARRIPAPPKSNP